MVATLLRLPTHRIKRILRNVCNLHRKPLVTRNTNIATLAVMFFYVYSPWLRLSKGGITPWHASIMHAGYHGNLHA